MNKKTFRINLIVIVLAVVIVISVIATALYFILNGKDGAAKLKKIDFENVFESKACQWQETLGTVERTIPTEISSEGLSEKYPVYGTVLAGLTDEEKDNILRENAFIMASESTYDAMDEYGNYYLNGEKTGKKIYKHIASEGMYYGDVSDEEKAVVERITISALEQRNYVTGLYAPAGEVVKIELSEDDLLAAGGELLICVGQVSHRNNINNIWKEKDFVRMPVIANKLSVKTTTAYVGSPLGGPIFIYPIATGKTFTVTVSGAVKYARYVHGLTTKEEVEEMKNYSAPYYDFEVWNLGVRLSGVKKYGSFNYENLVKTGDLWEKIVMTSRQVPTSANSTISVGYVYDCFVAAGAACAFQGGHSWVNAPCSWMEGAINYDVMVADGFWGNIHEYNHLYQSYGMEGTKTNEVTNNATSLLSYALYTKISDKRSLTDNDLTGWNRYTDPSRSLRETLAGAESGTPQNSLNAYADLIHSFGTDVFTAAARAQTGLTGADAWYRALSEVTDYNFTYYFETLLGQTLLDESKELYDTPERIVFVPIASVFQTGRSFFSSGEEKFIETVRPYVIDRGNEMIIDMNERLILPKGFEFTIKSISNPENGKIEEISKNVYKFTPGDKELSGKIEMTIGLESAEYKTRDVTLILEFEQKDKNVVEVTKYSFDEDIKYSTVKEAVANNFVGFSDKQEYTNTSTFLNGLKQNQIGIVEGKITILEDGNYAICLRSGRGNNTLYLSINDENTFMEALSLNTDHGGFSLSGEHVVTRELKKGDLLYFKEITLSKHYADAFTEIGIANLSSENPVMKTVPSSCLYRYDAIISDEDFVLPAKYIREYAVGNVYATTSKEHTLVEVNMPSWSENEKVENIFDGNQNTFYHNERNNFVSENNPFILTADVGKTIRVNNIKIVSRKTGQYNLPCTFTVHGSLNGSDWYTVGVFTDLALIGNTVTGNFNSTEFRYYKLTVTDTKSAIPGNKYVTISSIEFGYTFDGKEYSPHSATYYKSGNKEFRESRTISSFGKLIYGSGIVEYEFNGERLGLYVRQKEDCVIKITLDGKESEVSLSKSDEKTLAYFNDYLSGGNHKITIQVISGNLYVDSFIKG